MTLESPLVSIVTPSFNQHEFIEETICSVLAQSYSNIEYIIVDGQSTDGTIRVLDNYSERIENIIVEPDNGQSDAINKGLRMCNGSILMWLNSDDVLLPNAVAQAVDVFNIMPESLMIHGHSQLCGDSIKSQLVGLSNGDFSFKYPAFMSFPQPASFFRKTLIDQSGLLDTSLHYGMDFDLVVRAFLLGNITYYDSLVSRYRIHSSSKTNNYFSFVEDWRLVFSRFVNTFPEFSRWRQMLVDHGLHSGSLTSYSTRALTTDFNIFYITSDLCSHALSVWRKQYLKELSPIFEVIFLWNIFQNYSISIFAPTSRLFYSFYRNFLFKKCFRFGCILLPF